MGSSRLLMFRVVVSILFLLRTRGHGSSGTVGNEKGERVLDIGVVLNFGNLVGKEARIAMRIATRDFNGMSRGYKLKLHFENSGGKPLQAVRSAEKLIERKKVKAIVGLETGKEVELVAELGYRFQVPVISLARNPSGSTTPGLIQMGSDEYEQIRSIANIVQSFNRRRAWVIYEEDMYDDNYPLSLYLSEELRKVGSEIEHRLVLPPFPSITDPESVIKENLRKFQGKSSPIFIILDLSLPMANNLLKEAEQMGFFGGDSIWILAERVFDLLGSVDSNVTSSMKGAVGIVTDRSKKSEQYLDFSRKFRLKLKYKIDGFGPGVHVLRAYDSIWLLASAVNGASATEITGKLLMERIQQNKYDGLSGKLAFNEGRLLNPGEFEQVTVGSGKRSTEDIWRKLSGTTQPRTADIRSTDPIKIVVPVLTPLDKFVREEKDDSDRTTFGGFCIDVFNGILSIVDPNRTFEYEISPQRGGTYDDLVEAVYNKTYDMSVGDITILANRSEHVDFPQPYIESGLSMIVLAEEDGEKPWIFLQPFTRDMWMASGGVLICTMLTVWFLEQPSNPEFQGPWTYQLSTALWFTFCSLFFAHRERIHRKLTRIVLVVWFFMALILTQSYTASLTSMLTVQRLKPNQITIESLKQQNAKVGCDNSTFVCNYLETVHKFSGEALVGIKDYTEFYVQLKNRSIKAAFVEYPYERAFLSRYCSGFSATHQSYRFGGFGFAFQKGSPWTTKFSEAILGLSESGKLKMIGDEWFSQGCINSTTTSSDSNTQSLGLQSFYALFIFSVGTSALCLLLSYFFSGRNGDKGRADNADEQLHMDPQIEVDREMNELHTDQHRSQSTFRYFVVFHSTYYVQTAHLLIIKLVAICK